MAKARKSTTGTARRTAKGKASARTEAGKLQTPARKDSARKTITRPARAGKAASAKARTGAAGKSAAGSNAARSPAATPLRLPGEKAVRRTGRTLKVGPAKPEANGLLPEAALDHRRQLVGTDELRRPYRDEDDAS